MARVPGAISVARPALEIRALNVAYGRVPILHDLSLRLERGVIAVVGRNGMGKTTLCKTIMGLVRAKSGSIRVDGAEIANLAPDRIARAGVAYVPQGRRVWPSLSVEEHLRLAFRGDKTSAWTIERIWDAFPRLAERRGNGGGQLSGGEQQMLAISRALLANPRLLIMDEPTEGLAPVIVEHVERMLKALAEDGSMSILLIEQNLGVALDVADRVAIMLHGEIARDMASAELGADPDLQRRLLGVGRHAEEEEAPSGTEQPATEVRYVHVTRLHGEEGTRAGFTFAASARAPAYSTGITPTRFSADNRPSLRVASQPSSSGRTPPDLSDEDRARGRIASGADHAAGAALPVVPVAATIQRSAYVVGTFDTKRDELTFLANSLRRLGLRVVTVDLATSGRPSPADISPREVAGHHPDGAGAVFSGDRGRAVTAMATAFEAFMRTRRDVGGIISAGGSGGTALATAGMRALPIGIPKFMVSTVASADVSRYVGPSDISMMYSVTDVQGINRISEQVLANAAHGLAGMIGYQRRDDQRAAAKPAIGMTMFGVTTPCVQAVQAALRQDYDCLVFHATGTGGRSMEKLVDSRLLVGVLDITTTEIPDFLVGGVFAADADRMGAIIRHKIPYVGSCGALDMVNFNARDTVPARFQGRNLYIHNPNVTLMRTTAQENEAAGRFIAERLNRMEGPVRFLIPLGGVSLIDAPGKPFHDPAADRALFSTIERLFVPGRNRRLIKIDANINDPAFSSALVQNFRDIMTPAGAAPRAAHR